MAPCGMRKKKKRIKWRPEFFCIRNVRDFSLKLRMWSTNLIEWPENDLHYGRSIRRARNSSPPKWFPNRITCSFFSPRFCRFFFFTIEFSQPSMAIDISGRMDHGANSLEIIGFSVSRELCAECARRARYARH